MQIALAQGFRVGMERGEPASLPGTRQQEWDPCEQGTGRAPELRAGLDTDMERWMVVGWSPGSAGRASPQPQLRARATSGRDGCCVSRAGPCPQNPVLGCRAERGGEPCPELTDPLPSAAPL